MLFELFPLMKKEAEVAAGSNANNKPNQSYFIRCILYVVSLRVFTTAHGFPTRY